MAIVAMIIPRTKSAAVAQCSGPHIISQGLWKNITNNTLSSTLSTSSINNDPMVMDQLYDWSEYDQGLALGAYYWIHWLTQLPGGLLARKYGAKIIFGFGNLSTALLGLLIPIATHYHLYGLVAIRVIQGMIAGTMWPAMHDMTAKWIPPMERSRFVSSYLGSSVGAAITYPLCAIVINWFGWGAAFYVTSLIGIIWYTAWYFLVFDTPQQHPRISETERNYIEENTAEIVSSNHDVKVPWSQLLLSGPLWVTIIGHWGGAWGLSDWLLRSGRMSLKNVRKLATFVTTGGGAILTLGLAFSGCEPTLAIFFMMTGTAINGAVSAGTLASLVDLSPNFAGVLLGFCGLITAASGFISPLIVGILTNHKQTVEQWRLVFIIATVNLSVSAIIYSIWGTADVQSWNNCGPSTSVNDEELKKLNDDLIINQDKIDSQKITNKDDTISREKLSTV
ncbi:hypothetical protein PV325_010770 [Microctonus aethiopoides]|uniref:Major facilitator superfamily (MFS) profile domain-containing protein n=1 Tax=Microctonus aethiopoides TaxID=144406 RepID=A0AA39F724_9HYME|nr:hypothetical protein PV325_010770 [Microctonus aethiopoides]KAK0164151.1 hypothetical protein PV328_002812 [Microctonus aethiopoides]